MPRRPAITGMFIWPQIDDQRQSSLATAGVQTTYTSEPLYMRPPSASGQGQPLTASVARHGAWPCVLAPACRVRAERRLCTYWVPIPICIHDRQIIYSGTSTRKRAC